MNILSVTVMILGLLAVPISASAAEPTPKGVEVIGPTITVPKTLFVAPHSILATMGNFRDKNSSH